MQSLLGKGWPGSASSSELGSAEQRIGLRFPSDLRTALETHDGFPPLNLLSVSELDTVGAQAAVIDTGAFSGTAGAGKSLAAEDQYRQCLVVVAIGRDRKIRDKLFPSLLWCPANRESTWITLPARKSYGTFHDWLFERATERAAAGG